MSALPASVASLLLDIEGTTTPVSFVTDVLFPYARTRLRAYLEQHGDTPLLARLRDEHVECLQRGETPPSWTDSPHDARLASAAAFAEWLMDRDRKSTPLKELQGLIWKAGYERGDLIGAVYADVPNALARWRAQRLTIAIYSSGSVLAQQLLFRHSSAGDLTGLLHAFFDTVAGPKTDAESYSRICQQLGVPAAAVLFLSDAPRELDAARHAGLRVVQVMRPGNASTAASENVTVVRSFDEL